MEELKKEVKKQLKKSAYKMANRGYLVRKEPKPFRELSGRQRKKAIKAARREAKSAATVSQAEPS